MENVIRSTRRFATVAGAAAAVVATIAGCGGSSGPQVPSLRGHAATSSGALAAELRDVAQCIREHGVPNFPDPVLTASGQVYFDLRSIQNASPGSQDAARHACAGLAARAGFNQNSEPPAPPQLVAAGVRAAQCLRAHGLPAYRDPNSSTPYVPGGGFEVTGRGEIPGGKGPAFQRATAACRALVNAEIRASTIASLTR